MKKSKPKLISETTIVAVDVETTGFVEASDSIVEYGALRLLNGREIDRFQMLVDPGHPIGNVPPRVSGITQDMIDGQPGAEEGLNRFLEYLGDDVIMAHNARFDVGFIRATMKRCGRTMIGNPIIDTVALSRKAFPKLESHALPYLVGVLNLQAKQAHRAMSDVETCAELFLLCVERLSFMGDMTLDEALLA